MSETPTVTLPFNFGDRVYLDYRDEDFIRTYYIVCGFEVRGPSCIWVLISPIKSDATLLVEDYRLKLVK